MVVLRISVGVWRWAFGVRRVLLYCFNLLVTVALIAFDVGFLDVLTTFLLELCT